MPIPSLRDATTASDAERFVGRLAELTVAAEVLGRDTKSRILFVHGPGGIGKSSLLRAAARHAAEAGYAVRKVDARTLPADLDQAVASLVPAAAVHTCLVIDEVDVLGSTLEPLRERLLDLLPNTARILFAGRRAPAPSWREDGLDAIVVALLLRPLVDAAATELLRSRGVDRDAIPAIVAWGQGSPLALTVAASAPPGKALGGAQDLEQQLTAWLAGHQLLDVPRDMLEVAALARVVDARLLTAALPGRPTREGMRQLAALPVSARLGDAVEIHAVLASAIRARLRADEPHREAMLVRRIAEHLASRARLGEMAALLRLSQLLVNPELRAAIGNDPSDTYYADRPRPDELAQFGRIHGFDRGADWAEIQEWFARWPEQTLLMRRVEGRAVMYASFVAVGALEHAGAIEESLVAAAQRTDADPERSFAGIVMFADGPAEDAAESARLGSGAFMLQRGVGDTQSMLIHYPAPDRRPSLTAAIAVEVEGPLARPVAISDFRPAGVIGTVEAMVLGEHGFAPRTLDPETLLTEDEDPERIERLRVRLDEVFSNSAADRRLRQAIELVHCGTRATEQQCLDTLNVSRRTWFRLLRAARERVIES